MPLRTECVLDSSNSVMSRILYPVAYIVFSYICSEILVRLFSLVFMYLTTGLLPLNYFQNNNTRLLLKMLDIHRDVESKDSTYSTAADTQKEPYLRSYPNRRYNICPHVYNCSQRSLDTESD